MKRILIDVPNRIRDGIGLVYLKILLERFGYKVKIVNGFEDTFFTLLKFKPHAIVLGNIVEIKGHSLVKYARCMGCKIIVLPTEGTVYPKNQTEADNFFSKRFTKDYNNDMDLFLSWGPSFRDSLVKFLGIDRNKTKVCGCPRFDVYVGPLNRMLKGRERFCKDYGIDPKKPIVTLPTIFVTAETDLKRAKKSIFHAENYAYICQRKRRDTKERAVVIDNFLKFAKEMSSVNFIIKLHPWEEGGYYLNRIKHSGVDNVRLIKNENIANVINNSDVWVHPGCTTAKEAHFMGKPILTLAFIKEYETLLDSFSRMCDTARDYKEMRNKIRGYLSGERPKVNPQIDKYIADTYYRIDGMSTERCAKEIKQFLDTCDVFPKHCISFHIVSSIIHYDLRLLLRRCVYQFKTIRNIYLTLRWRKDKELLRFVQTEVYGWDFMRLMRNYERSIMRYLS